LIDEIKSFIVTFLGAICAGWLSKLATLITDPIVSVVQQYAWRGGMIVVVFVAAVLVKQAFEDYQGYVAMGVFAIPAIAMLFVPWDVATILAGFSAVILSFMGKKTIFG
jgi:hypothetical protein